MHVVIFGWKGEHGTDIQRALEWGGKGGEGEEDRVL